MYKSKIPQLVFIFFILFVITCNKLPAQNTVIERSGDIILIALPVTTLASTFLIDDTKGSWQFVKSLVLTEALTYGLKLSVNKPRPDASNNHSFPSGHTSTTFQSASFLHMRYGFKYSIPAYALAGFTAFSRIDAKKHDSWDILVGAIIGIGSSYLFTTEYQKQHMELSFNSKDDNYSLGFIYKF
ncbi:phosphatase PAP2 family protein [Olleya sp. 1-3]|uniref:phosphatase PAP2 family protein n=1 Tax=Olleya sp. 1-3 TaxID=2058323 RepID=UPI000C32E3A6|nr:phosphatase PAP2 family protein [Olleya sp. 1-3]PKG51749.1 PAP2 family protein [Olleya sp. 1-3]